MADLVNLNRARKTRDQAVQAATAAANRTKYGRTPAERQRDAAAETRRAALLDGARRDVAAPGPGEGAVQPSRGAPVSTP